jgi:uncharacterized protein YciI
MSKLFVVLIKTLPHYLEYSKNHPEHQQEQLAWFGEQHKSGRLLLAGPFSDQPGTGMWILRAESREEALALIDTSPRKKAGVLAEGTEVHEWPLSIGAERLAPQ